MSYYEHLVVPPERAQGSADGEGCFTANSGVDLVEDKRRRGGREHQTRREHGPGELAAGGDLGHGKGRLARVRPEEELDLRAGRVVADADLETRARERQLLEMGLDCCRQLRRRLPADRTEVFLGLSQLV